uniref:Peroxidase-like protein n=1 Tax=Crassostrea virginica TaxID=6565 RepID=A0A8B8DIU8_CRAVI|nr:peroxidase-like protein [Crassostrea virginica]
MPLYKPKLLFAPIPAMESHKLSSVKFLSHLPETSSRLVRHQINPVTMSGPSAWFTDHRRGMITTMIKEYISELGPPVTVPIETNSTGSKRSFYHAVGRNTPMKFHYSFSRQNDAEMVVLLSDRAHLLASICKSTARMMNARNVGDVRSMLNDPAHQAMVRRQFNPYCYEHPVCDQRQKYRSPCGACNNLEDPLLGKAFTPFRRIVPSAYDDGVEAPRTLSVLGGSLPSARDVSNAVHREDITSVNSQLTPFLTTFGQFLDHDFTSTPLMQGENGEIIEDCCSAPDRFECFSIAIPANDPHFRDPARKCMHVVRSDAAPPLDCSVGIRQQQNQRSSFIDGTMIYGFNRAKEDSLRSGQWGYMKVSEDYSNTPGMMPKSREDTCNIKMEDRQAPETQHCFDAGDHRHTENPLLTVIHTAFLRRHNLIATQLRERFGILDDELLFQETKRIVIAELQHITYKEFLPVVLNKELLRLFNLRINKPAHDDVYNSSSDPRTINAFAAAVFRFGHTLVRQIVGADNGNSVFIDSLFEHFDRPRLTLSSNGFGHEHMANWKARTGSSQPDSSIVDAIRNRLFESESLMLNRATNSFDLAALNIQRGRDHGLPGYNVYRQWCGFPPARHFGTWTLGLVDHDAREAAKLRSIYRHPDDIDLFAGGLSERRLPGALLGPTFSCILAFQFKQLREGDRFWYENPHPIHGFTTEQLLELKKTTLAKIMCSTAEGRQLMEIQPSLMVRTNQKNPPLPCVEILEGHALGYDIGAFRTIFPRVRPSNRNTSIRPLTTRNRKIVIPWNPSLQQLMSSRLSNKLITRKGIIHVPIQRRYKRRILLNKRKPLYFKRIVKI